MLPYGRQDIDDDDIKAVIDALKSDYLTTGPKVEDFEKHLCQASGAEYSIACSNGTTGLHLAFLAAGVKKGDHVVVPSVTFLATANAVRYCGAEVLFCDTDPYTGLMTDQTLHDALSIAKKNNYEVKAVVPVHLAGQPVDLKAIRDVLNASEFKGAKIISDACHAIGGTYDGVPIGGCKHEDFSVFSFHPVKMIAMGEGGAVTTNNAEWAKKIKTLRHHGMEKDEAMPPWGYEMHMLGYNYRVTDFQCALGISQLKKLSNFVEKRENLVCLYNDFLNDYDDIIPPIRVQDDRIGWHLYAVRINFQALGVAREKVMLALSDKGIGTQVHYIPVHTQPYYKERYGDMNLPNAEKYYERTLSLPLHTQMNEKDVHHVINSIKEVLSSNSTD